MPDEKLTKSPGETPRWPGRTVRPRRFWQTGLRKIIPRLEKKRKILRGIRPRLWEKRSEHAKIVFHSRHDEIRFDRLTAGRRRRR
jgi:hypothetical protein